MRFIGSSNDPNGLESFRVLPLARAQGVAEIVSEVPQRVPFLTALSAIRASDGVLVLGTDEPHYTASKIYGVLMSGRPYLSVFHELSSAHEILSRAGGGVSLGFVPSKRDLLLEPLVKALSTFVDSPRSFAQVHEATYAEFTGAATARRFAEVFRLAALAL